ncbi:MAG: polyribonucleotide nucleotidyltransferase [Dehalococcoidia bacterium]|nr:polyribonucleotide nucleotidyltransferase [Dehalococcoidia bacterium]
MTTTAAQTRTFTTEIEGKPFEIGLGRLAPNALSACTIRYGDSVLLVTVCDGEPRAGIDFFPLTVDFEERMYAIGKIPGSFFRREGRPGTDATLAARMTDRPIRPLFPKGFKREVQVVATLLASDRENPADPLATTGASIVINLSPLPFEGPVSSVRVGRINGRLKAFPTYQEAAQSDLELTVAATNDSIVMLEAGGKQIPEAELIEAIEYGERICRQLNDLQLQIIRELGRPKMEWHKPADNAVLQHRVDAYLQSLGDAALKAVQSEGFSGIDQMGRQVFAELSKEDATLDEKTARAAAEVGLKALVRSRVVTQGLRADGRAPEQIRPLQAEVGVLPRVHGSGLFQRGETQVLSVATLGALRDRAKLDNIDPTEWKMFMHHYNFPPFSTGEARPLRGAGRREIGHGMMGEKALLAVLPSFEDFPYTLRVVSDVLSSNGSTSQASICASSMALMDAGVPIKAPVAGIAMGLMTSDENATTYKILTDIAGIEDAFGDMDFKVAGTEAGVTAVQMDIKLKRLPANFMQEVFSRAREARMTLLGVMKQAIAEPRDDVGEFAPKITTIHIDPSKIGAVIGPGGRVINAIIKETGASIDVQEDGSVFVGGANKEGVRQAVRQIEGLTRELMPGEVFDGTVVRIMSFGAFVEILPGKDGMVHISELGGEGRVEHVEDVVKLGDKVKVRVMEIDNLGRVNLTMRGVDDDGPVGLREGGDEGGAREERPRSGGFGRPGGGGGDRGGRGGGGGGRGGPRRDGGGGGGFNRGPRPEGGGGGDGGGERFGSGGGYGAPRGEDAPPRESRPTEDRPPREERPQGDAPRPSGGGGRRW